MHKVSLCDQILSLRVTALEELDANRSDPYSRHYFRTLGPGRRPVQFAVVGPSQFTPELELELMQRGFDGVAIRDPTDDEVERLGDFHLAPELSTVGDDATTTSTPTRGAVSPANCDRLPANT